MRPLRVISQVVAISLAASLASAANANGAPGFVPAFGSPFPTGGDGAQSLVAEDFNRDTNMDVAVANRESNAVSILLGGGNGGLSASGSYSTGGQSPTALAAADFDLDGDTDLAVTNCGAGPRTICGTANAGDVSVLLGDGGGAFVLAAGSPHATGGDSPLTVAAGDLNRDDKPDVVVGNAFSNNVSLLLGDGHGGLSPAPGSPFPTGKSPRVDIGDFDNDGNPDVVAANFHPDNNVTLFLGDGQGGLTSAPSSPFPTLGRSALDVTVADMDRDGNLDVAVANFNTDTISLLFGDGQGNLDSASGSPFPAGVAPIDVAAADFDKDGNLDMAIARLLFVGRASVLLADGRGGFLHAPGSPLDTGGYGTFSVAIGDFNADGKPDLAFANFDSDDVSVLLNDLIVRSDFKNGAKYCEAQQASLGDEEFKERYGSNGNRGDAFGRCVSSSH